LIIRHSLKLRKCWV